MSRQRIKAYAFDWDDNILYMPTKMILFRNREHCMRLRSLSIEELITLLDPEDLSFLLEPDHDEKVFADGNEWETFLSSTANYARLRSRTDLHLTRLQESYRNFGDNEQFLIDLRAALEQQRFGPSYEKLKRAILDVRPIRIITARGQAPSLFERGLSMLVDFTFSDAEKEFLASAVKEHGYESVEAYIADQRYYPVSSQQFKEEFGVSTPESKVSTEQAKILAITRSVTEIVEKHYTTVGTEEEFSISFGFSDDDARNVAAAEKLFQEVLALKYPHVRFVLYDTSDPSSTKKKILSP